MIPSSAPEEETHGHHPHPARPGLTGGVAAVFRIHFTAQDLACTRVHHAPDPLWEITLSSHVLMRRNDDPLLAGWHRRSREALRRGTMLRERSDLFLSINSAKGDFPDFLTPGPHPGSLGDGLELISRTPVAQLRRDVNLAAGDGAVLPPSARELTSGDPGAVRDLTVGMRDYHDAIVGPQWSWVNASFNAEYSARTQILARGGLAAMLNSLHPSVRFADGVLEILDYPRERDLHLGGRGLVLVPSFFKRSSRPLTMIDPELPPVLVYPVDRAVGLVAARQTEALSALVGRARAAILELCAEGGTTSAVAARLHLSPSTASEHLTVLRRAGLIVSERRANSVEHRLAALGLALLEGRASCEVGPARIM